MAWKLRVHADTHQMLVTNYHLPASVVNSHVAPKVKAAKLSIAADSLEITRGHAAVRFSLSRPEGRGPVNRLLR